MEEIAPHVGRVLGGVRPDFLVSTLGWAALGVGDAARAADAFGEVLVARGELDRQRSELLLGAACAQATLYPQPATRRTVEAALELCRRVDLVLPAGMVEQVDRTLAMIDPVDAAHPYGLEPADRPTDELADWVQQALLTPVRPV